MIRTIVFTGSSVKLIDQRKLPQEEVYLECKSYDEVAQAIELMVVRGAPAIGVTAAYGVVLGIMPSTAHNYEEFWDDLYRVCQRLEKTRPTAANLFWAIERMKNTIKDSQKKDPKNLKDLLINEARIIHDEDIKINLDMGNHGKVLIKNGDTILTHCNAGGLATGGYGTALGVIEAAFREGKKIQVFADETRPFLQGARLTAWEMVKLGIPVTVITDNMAGYFMSKGRINLVITGADRIARNGDAANKIGTYSVAWLAKVHNIPFYIAAPLSTIDPKIATGEQIPIEFRSPREITHIGEYQLVPDGAKVENPAFDVTPHALIKAIITEKGILDPPFEEKIMALFNMN